MLLERPVTFTPPAVVRPGTNDHVPTPVTLTELDVTIVDNSKKKSVLALIVHFPTPLVLWEKEAYTAIGDYTQAAAENRVLELLGTDPAAALVALLAFPGPHVG